MPQLTSANLAAALEFQDPMDRADVFEQYSKQKPTQDAVPYLRRALSDDYTVTVKVAAKALGKLGPLAKEAMKDLIEAAYRHDPVLHSPQEYPQCVEAMSMIQPEHPGLLPLIKQYVGLDNWVPLSASLRALKTIGTPEALDLLNRMARFWEPELNKMQKRVVEDLVHSVAKE